jgi:hypothetical protein
MADYFHKESNPPVLLIAKTGNNQSQPTNSKILETDFFYRY